MAGNTNVQGTRLVRILRAYPMALALVGAECGWLAISATGAGERVRGRASDASRHARAWAEQLRGNVRGKYAGVRSSTSHAPYPMESGGYPYAREESAQAMAQAAGKMPPAHADLQEPGPAAQDGAAGSRGAIDAYDRVNDRPSGRSRIGEILADHPFATFALAVLAGAAIHLALPVKMARGPTDEASRARLRERAAT